jgi:hypothetical protein
MLLESLFSGFKIVRTNLGFLEADLTSDGKFNIHVRIPVKVSSCSGGRYPPVPGEALHPFRRKVSARSERSDAGVFMI